MKYILAIDQGTSSTRAFIFTSSGAEVCFHARTLHEKYPHDGWVEQDPLEMWNNILVCIKEALLKSKFSIQQIASIGITNQRESTIIWDKKTGTPIFPCIVWSDRRTAQLCGQLQKDKINEMIQEKTGLLIDPYFSATKIMWLLDHIPNARKRTENGELLFGTIDSYILWHLTKGKVHATDATNASRTMLFNIHDQRWDDEILQKLNIPEKLLPTVLDTNAFFGTMDKEFFGHEIPITAMIGDQQSALVGQACFQPGTQKITFGTGCFVLLNTGNQIIKSKHRLLSTIAYRLQGKVTYALEGSVFSAGIIVKWLRDKLKMIASSQETEMLAQKLKDTGGVYLVPAFTGLGAPYWNPNARAALLGMTNNTGVEHIVRAGLESVVYQTKDLLTAMIQDYPQPGSYIRVDGGMTNNNWLMQFLADLLDQTIDRPTCIETTALGAALMAALGAGIYSSLEEIATAWKLDKQFMPAMDQNSRENFYNGWKSAIRLIN